MSASGSRSASSRQRRRRWVAAVLGVDSGDFLTGGASERLQEITYFIDCFLETAVLGYDPTLPWEKPVAGLQASILIAATTADPPLLERVLNTADHAPEAHRMMAGLLANMAVERLEALAELGLLTIDTHFRVPPALVGCFAHVFDNVRVLADLGLAEAPDDADFEPTSAESAALQSSVTAAQPAATSTLQLKIMLKNSKPPIWRRVLVPAGMPLTQLHQVIQALFGWLDYHLHQFQTGGFDGPTYAPVDPEGEDDFYGEPSLDESTVTVGELLPAAGSVMTYTYDFGDDWVHAHHGRENSSERRRRGAAAEHRGARCRPGGRQRRHLGLVEHRPGRQRSGPRGARGIPGVAGTATGRDGGPQSL
nr:plasmid pRiA4b ORF-3 family protein [Arthrobacter sp. V4I6]